MKKLISALAALCILWGCFSGCANSGGGENDPLGNGWQPVSSMEVAYATNFAVDYYDGGYKLITLSTGDRFLVVPEGAALPDGIDRSITPLYQPLGNIYLVSTPVMCLFDALDELGAVKLSGTKAEGWYNENAKKAMESGSVLFAGKYSEPDYELLLSSGCGLAIENTMINHTPEVKEKLVELGIPVMVELSSLETHPLGRTEWIKVVGALLNKEEEAARLFDAQVEFLKNEVPADADTGKTVAFFYISSSGSAVVRKTGDYVTKMIELAGGEYIFKDIGDPGSATSTVTLEMEQFYSVAKDADFIIYNSTIDGGLSSLDELVAKNSLLADFKAVKDGNVWCTDKNLFQETMQFGQMIKDMNTIFTNTDPALTELDFLYRLS